MAKVGDPATPDPGRVLKAETPPVAATAPLQPAPPPVEPVPTPETKGPIPFDRHEAALKNARTKAAQEATQTFQQQYAPHVQLGQQIQAAPVPTVVGLVNELANHPDYGPQIISELARTLGARRGRTASPETDEPQPDLTTADGSIRTYSAEQLAKREAWLKSQWMSEVQQQLGPIQEREKQQQARERLDTATKDADTRMSKVLAPFQALPEFQANRPAIAEKTSALMSDGHEPQVALGLAVAHVLREVVLPSRTAQSRNDLVAEAVKKSTGTTTVPGATPAAPASRPTSMLEGFRRIAV